MSLSDSKECSFKEYSSKPVAPSASALMIVNVPSTESPEQPSLADRDVRELIRLIQCPQCSKPFTTPVTLPCGHTVCATCLPPSRTRANISYPPDRLQGRACPLPKCRAEHASAECCVDVTLMKLMELIHVEISKHGLSMEATPTILVREMIPLHDGSPMEEKGTILRERKTHGGRLLSTFTMAEKEELRYSSDVAYTLLTENDHRDLDMALLDRLQEAAHKQLDCLVCYNLMLDPTTTPCGHTFCRRCLSRVMDHSNICPVCRRDLHFPASLENKPSNVILVSLLEFLCPDLVAARAAALTLEEQPGHDALSTPLFVCTLALPNTPTFLHIFEPRYRLMMRRCVEGNKQFGMVMYNRTSALQGDLGATPFMEYGTLLEIVNYELLHDGRSFVETRGVSRFRIRAHGMLDGYRVGRVERVEDLSLAEEQDLEQEETTIAQRRAAEFIRENPQVPIPPDIALDQPSTQELLDFCMRFIDEMRSASAPWLSAKIVQVYGPPPHDPSKFPYWFACVLPIDEKEKYVLLHTTRVRQRLKIVKDWIERIQTQRGQVLFSYIHYTGAEHSSESCL